VADTFTILIVEDEKVAGKVLHDHLKKKGYEAKLFEKAEEALLYFRRQLVDLVLLDYKLPGISGEECFEKIKEINPTTPVIFMTAYSSVEKAVRLLKQGAYTYLTKPLEMDELFHNIDNALERVTLIRENRRLQQGLEQKFSVGKYIFNSENMQQVLNLVSRAADSEANILITGESGTGKEVIANIIHHASSRKNNPLVKVSLSALPPTLIEAELFGAVKGAYTGASQTRQGKFEEAGGGSIFLDEIGELPLELQVKLLRVIQEREITKLGSNTPVKVDIRLITATNRDLDQLVREKAFREDLFFRLNVINILLPPLRERKEDIPLLVDLFIKKINRREGKQVRSISREALNLLMRYHYPGNLRELENIVERSVVLARDDVLTVKDLPVFLDRQDKTAGDYDDIIKDASLSLPERLNIIEKNIIQHTLQKHHHNQTRAAQELGISESGLRYKIQSLHIPKA
jgi:two-component system NtrC family response regulator